MRSSRCLTARSVSGVGSLSRAAVTGCERMSIGGSAARSPSMRRDQLVAVGRPQHAERRRREVPRPALVDRALAVVAELGGADERRVREHLVQPAPARRRAATTVGAAPAVGGEAPGERARRPAPASPGWRRWPRPSSGRSAVRPRVRTVRIPVTLRTTSGASTIAIVSCVDQSPIHVDVSSRPRAQPASRIRPDGSTATSPVSFGALAGATLTPGQVDPEDTRTRSVEGVRRRRRQRRGRAPAGRRPRRSAARRSRSA